MCDCKKKLQDLMNKHRLLCSRIDFDKYVIINPVETNVQVEPEISKEVVKQIVDEFVSEIIVYKEPEMVITNIEGNKEENKEEELEEDTVELTDISPEELEAQEAEEKRIRDELALIELTRLTKKKIRSKK